MLADNILIFGGKDQGLLNLLERLGYKLQIVTVMQEVENVLRNGVVDCVFIDESEGQDAVGVVDFFLSYDLTKDLPIVIRTMNELDDKLVSLLQQYGEQIIVLKKSVSAGIVVAKIAMQLRLRKFAGENEATASLSEVNAKLRDLNKHFEDDLKEAVVIQQSLIPAKLPNDPRFSIAVSYEPLEGVGGDWYYVEQRSDGQVAVQIADVTGHGLPAAFIAAMTKLAMTAAGELPPNLMLTKMNQLMSPNLPDGRFVTIFSYLYDPSTGDLEYARGGHPFGLLLSGNNVTELDVGGFALGFMDETEYQVEKVHLNVGDVVLVYTDALTESQNMSGEMFELSHLSEALVSAVKAFDSSLVLRSIREKFDQFRDGRIVKDDVTVIALKRLL